MSGHTYEELAREMIDRLISDGWLGPRQAAEIRAEVDRLTKEAESLRAERDAAQVPGAPRAMLDAARAEVALVVDGLEREVEGALTHLAMRGKGGMQVPFHGDFANTPPSALNRLRWWIRELRAAPSRSADALSATPAAEPRDRFEAEAEAFHRETGMLAPGKDQSPAMGGSPSDEERRAAWNVWKSKRASTPPETEPCGVCDLIETLRELGADPKVLVTSEQVATTSCKCGRRASRSTGGRP